MAEILRHPFAMKKFSLTQFSAPRADTKSLR
jgi:hypothetical protein